MFVEMYADLNYVYKLNVNEYCRKIFITARAENQMKM